MLIKYELSIEDLIALNRYQCANSPAIRRTKLTTMMLVSSLLIIGSLLIPPFGGVSRPIIVGLAVVGAVTFSVFFSYRFPAHLDHSARRALTRRLDKDDLGQHEIEADGEGFTVRTDVSETRQLWRGVNRIVETHDHVFVYVSPVGTHVIPKHAVTEGDVDAFLFRARELCQVMNPEESADQQA